MIEILGVIALVVLLLEAVYIVWQIRRKGEVVMAKKKALNMGNTLRECPFCGSIHVILSEDGDHWPIVVCEECGVGAGFLDEDEAIAAWNRRVGKP